MLPGKRDQEIAREGHGSHPAALRASPARGERGQVSTCNLACSWATISATCRSSRLSFCRRRATWRVANLGRVCSIRFCAEVDPWDGLCQSPIATNGRGSPSYAPHSACSPRRVGDAVPRCFEARLPSSVQELIRLSRSRRPNGAVARCYRRRSPHDTMCASSSCPPHRRCAVLRRSPRITRRMAGNDCCESTTE